MREILFRGKYRYCNEWLYGDLTHGAPHGEEPMIRTHDRELNGVFAVEPDTVGQYTGLTDKNGKRIFEGDIVECWSEGVGARGVVQQRKDGLWIIYPSWQKHIMWGLYPDDLSHTTAEVIGNIYDNPELVDDELLQKPMTLEDALGRAVFLELRGASGVRGVIIPIHLGERIKVLADSNPIKGGHSEWINKCDYGKTWRCWGCKPTDEERSAAEWLKP